MSWQQEWQSVIESPEYQQSKDIEKEGKRQEFFAKNIAPQFHPMDRPRAKDIFDEYTAPYGNPDGNFLSDAYYLAKSGFQGAVGDLSRGATLGYNNPVAEYMNSAAEENMQQVTPSMLEAMEATGIDYEGGGFSGISIKDDSSVKGLIGQTIQGIGSLPVSIGAGGAYGKAFGMAGRAATAGQLGARSYAANVASGNIARANQILSQRDRLAAVTNAAGFGTMGGQMMTGGVASQAYDEIIHAPIEDLRQLQPYQEKLQEAQQLYPDNPAMAEAHARETLAKDTSLANRAQSFGLGFVTSVMTGPIEQRILMGRGAATRKGNIGRGMLTEAVEEFSESGGQQLLSNQAQIDIAQREMNLMDGVLSTGMTGAVSGSLVGGALGGAGRPNRPKSKEALNADLESARSDISKVQDQLKDESLEQTKRDELEMTLGQHVERAYNIKRQYDQAPTEEQLSRNKKGEPEPASDTGVNQPIERPDTRDWVPSDIDQRIGDAKNTRRKLQSSFSRGMRNQGTISDAQFYESALQTNQSLINSYEMLRDNRHNAQYFESQEVFDDWIKRKLQGGQTAWMADAELAIRKKGRAMQHGVANINAQVTGMYQQDLHAEPQSQSADYRQQSFSPAYQESGTVDVGSLRSEHADTRQWRPSGELTTPASPDTTTTEQPVAAGMASESQSTRQAQDDQRQSSLLNELQQLTNLKGSGDVRNVLSHIRSGDDYNLRYGNKQLNIRSGRVDPDQLQDFVNYSKKQAPLTDQQHRVADVRERGVMPGRQSGKTFESAMTNRMQELSDSLPDNDVNAQKMGYVLGAMGNQQANVSVNFGDGQTLQITNGKVNPKTLNEFVRDMEAKADQQKRQTHQRQQQHRKGLQGRLEKATGRKGGQAVKQSRLRSRAFEKLKALPDSIKDHRFYKSVSDAITNNKSTNIHFGNKQQLAIKNGKYEVGQFNKFIDYMRSEGNRLEEKAKRDAKLAEDKKRREAERSETITQFVKRSIDNWVKKTGDNEFAVKRATHIHTDPVNGEKSLVQYGGEPIEAGHVVYYDHQGIEFGGRPDEFTPIPGREFMYEDLLPQQEQLSAKDDFLINQATHIGIDGSGGRAVPIKKTGKHQYVDIDGNELSFFASGEKPIKGNPRQALEDARKEAKQIQDELSEKINRKEPYPESEATHVYRPKDGDQVLIKPIESSVAGGNGWYRRPDGTQMFLGDEKRRIKSLKEIEADKERQRKAAEAEERKAALEKARELQDIARQEAERKVRFKNEFPGQHHINRFLGDHGIGYDSEQSGLTVVEKKGDFHLIDTNGDRLDSKQLTEYVDAIKNDGFFKYKPPYKPEPVKIAKITQKNLKDKDLIGNGRGNGWNRKHNAEDQLKKKGLADTHYVTGDNLFFIRRKPDLSGIKWYFQSYETVNGVIETIMVPESPVTSEQQSQIREFTGERFTQYRDPKSPIIEGMADPKKGDLVVKLRRSNRDSFLNTLQETKPPEKTTEGSDTDNTSTKIPENKASKASKNEKIQEASEDTTDKDSGRPILTKEQAYPEKIGNYRIGPPSDNNRFPVVDISHKEAEALRDFGGIGPDDKGTGLDAIVWFDQDRRELIKKLLNQWSNINSNWDQDLKSEVKNIPEIWSGKKEPFWFNRLPSDFAKDLFGSEKWSEIPESKRIEAHEKYWRKWHPKNDDGGWIGYDLKRLGPHYNMQSNAFYMDGEFLIEQSHPVNTPEKFRSIIEKLDGRMLSKDKAMVPDKNKNKAVEKFQKLRRQNAKDRDYITSKPITDKDYYGKLPASDIHALLDKAEFYNDQRAYDVAKDLLENKNLIFVHGDEAKISARLKKIGKQDGINPDSGIPTAESTQTEVSRGITDQPGELNGINYNRRADIGEIPRTPRALAEFANNLQNGDLLIDKFGNERGVIAKVNRHYVKLVNKDVDTGNNRFFEYSLTDHLPKEKGLKQLFASEYDKIKHQKSDKPKDKSSASLEFFDRKLSKFTNSSQILDLIIEKMSGMNAEIAKKIKDSGIDVEFRYVSEDFLDSRNMLTADKVDKSAIANFVSKPRLHGLFFYDSRRLYLRSVDQAVEYHKNHNKEFTTERLAELILHEMTHAVIGTKIQDRKDIKNRDLSNPVDRIYDIYDNVKSELKKQGKDSFSVYGLKNADEFVAEALGNSEFQQQLKNIKYGKYQSAWGAFVGSVRRILGLPDNSKSALESVMQAFDDIVSGSEKMSKDVAAENKTINYKNSEQSVIDHLRENASRYDNHYDGKLLSPAASDYVEKTIEVRRRLNKDELTAIAEKHSLPFQIVNGFEQNGGFGYGYLQDQYYKGKSEAIKEFIDNRPKNKSSKVTPVSTIKGSRALVNTIIKDGLMNGRSYSDSNNSYRIEDRSGKGTGWVLVKTSLENGRTLSRGGFGKGVWTQQEAVNAVLSDLDFGINESAQVQPTIPKPNIHGWEGTLFKARHYAKQLIDAGHDGKQFDDVWTDHDGLVRAINNIIASTTVEPVATNYNQLVSNIEEGNNARRKIKDTATPVNEQYATGFNNTGQKPTKGNIKKYLNDQGVTGYLDRTIKEVQQLVPLVEADRLGVESQSQLDARNQPYTPEQSPVTTGEPTNEAGRTGSDESLEGVSAGEIQEAATPASTEVGSGEGSRPSSRNDGDTNRPGTDASGSEGDSGTGADLSGAGVTSTEDLGQRTGGVNSGGADFTIDSKIADNIAGDGKKSFSEVERFNNNVAAIQLLKELDGRPATAEQQEVLSKYVGWGGLQSAFADESGKVRKGWKDRVKQLKELLTEDEYAAALASTPNAHYTTPAIVNAIYAANMRFGAHHGRILEPSVGTGNFIGLMPPDMRGNSNISAVELDVISGQIAQKLYPSAKINTPMAFQDFDLANNSYDMVVANPPFGATPITDSKRKDISGWRIHNYFMAKSMDALRPGGVMSVVVSKGWMDSNYNQQGRDRMFRDAKLLGAFRLPGNAFKANANTDVTTDMIFLQKRDEALTAEQLKEPPAGEIDYRNKASFTGADDSTMNINQYFADNPDRILGDAITSETGMYGPGARDVVVARDGFDWHQALNDGIGQLPQRIYNPENNVTLDMTPDTSMDIHHAEVNGLYLSDDGKLMRRNPDIEGDNYGVPVTGYTNDKGEFISFKSGDMAKLKQLLPMARTARELIRMQITDATDSDLQTLRSQLNQQYDEFVKSNKALSRDVNKRLLYNSDPTTAPMLLALESKYQKEISKAVAKRTGQQPRKEKATKADIFTRRTQSPYSPPKTAESGQAGLIISLSQTGKVDMAMMSDLTGKDQKTLYQELQGQIYFDPKTGWQTKDAYLSGNVKEKLRQAQEMVDNNHFDDLGQQLGTQFKENVLALKQVIPKDVAANEITVRMGAVWQPPSVISDFWKHLMGSDGEAQVSFVPQTNKWFFKGRGNRADKITKWSSEGAPANWLIDRVLNNRQIIVTYKDSDGNTFTDKKATESANIKAEEIQSEFESWLWKDGKRREQLTRLYNDTMNTTVNRNFDGSHLSFPGKISDDIIKLRTTQSDAIWRTLQNPTTLLDHVVGAGKTFTMIGSAMEMRRMGLAKKPVIVVPNHLVEQWASDFALLYPNSKVLAATAKDFSARKRKQLFARVATGDWDAVIVSHSSFGKLPSDPKAEETFLKQQLEDLTQSEKAVREAEGKDSRSTKELENARQRMQEKLKKLLENTDKDTGLTFQELGIDAMFLDEAHEFKNLEFQTSLNRVKNINPSGSNKASDLFIKTQSINNRGGKLVFATGTPISNSMAEMFTMQRYLGYEALKSQGLSHFDAWAKQFGKIDTKLERKPSGKYEPESRFAKFINLPELMQQSREFSDVINNSDIIAALKAEGKGKHVPDIKGGRPANTVASRSLYQEGYMADIEYRFGNMPDDPRVDNPLKATNDARKAALDMRMIYPNLPDFSGSKINRSVDNMMRLYHDWSNDKGTQLVFCDLSTPKGKSTDKAIKDFREKLTGLTDSHFLKNRIKNTEPSGLYDLLLEMSGDDIVNQDKAMQLIDKTNPDDIQSLGAKFDVYNDVKKKLIAKGVPESEIAFIHDANTDAQKSELFAKVNSGAVRFLLGSTAKMGAGTNVQERMVALHHLDAPWRPSDLEQREGRIIRQGNQLYIRDPQGFQVEIHRYATEQTYDVNMWQMLEIKANFIEQIRNGDPSVREAQDVAGEAASAAEMKAASSGDPRILEQVELQRRLNTLQNLRRTHQQEQTGISMSLDYKKSELSRVTDAVTKMETAQAAVEPVQKDKKGNAIVSYKSPTGETYSKSTEAITAITNAINSTIGTSDSSAYRESQSLGTFRGLDVHYQLGVSQGATVLDVWMTGKNNVGYDVIHNMLLEGSSKYEIPGIISRLNNAISRMDKKIKQDKQRAERIPNEIKGLQEQQGQPFKYAKEYEAKKVRNQQLLEELGSTDSVNETAQALPEYSQLLQEKQYYDTAVESATNDDNRLIHQVQASRVNRLLERLKYAPEGKEADIAKTVNDELAKIKTETQDLSQYAQVASRYSLSDKPYSNRNYQTKAIAKGLERSLGDVASVVQHESDLPAHVRDQIAQDDVSGRIKGIYDPLTDQVYVIANRAENLQDGIRTALHEAVGHKGLRNLLGDALNNTLDGIYRSLPESQIRSLRETYLNQIAGKPQQEQRRIIAEEYLAHLAETQPTNNLLQRAIARIRNWLRNHFPSLKYSNNDIRQLVMDASKKAQDPSPGSDTSSGATFDTPDSLRYKFDKINNMDKQQAKKLLNLNAGSMKEWIRANGLGFLGGRQIADIYHKLFEKMKDGEGITKNLLDSVNNMTQALSTLRNQWAHRGGQVDNKWSKLARDKNAYNTLSDLMHESTIAGVDPRWSEYKPKYGEISELQQEKDRATTGKQSAELQRQINEERQRRKDYDHLKEKYRLLGKSNALATDIYNDVAQYYKDQFDATQEALYNRVKGMELDPQARGQLKAEIDAMFHRAVHDGPYFPLMRFGDFAVIGKTPEGEYYREHFESKKDMDLGIKELQRKGYKIDDSGKNLRMDAAKMGGVSEFSGKIYKALQSNKMAKIDPDAKAAFLDEINQISLAMLPELSAAKRGMHRRKVPGYDTNARRAFNSVALHGANRLGRIEYGWRIDADITRMEQVTAVGYEGETNLTNDERIIGHSVAAEMRKRHELNMNPNGHPLAAAIANFTFFQYLGASAGAGFVNMTQNVLVGLPILSGRYGMRRSARFMGSAAKDFVAFGKQKMDGHEDYLNKAWWSVENIKPNKNITADEIQLIKELVEDGTIEITQAHSMASQAGNDISPDQQPRRELMDKLVKGSGAFFHNAEIFNRQVMALTAYRLYKADKKGNFDAAKAKDFVRKSVFDAHFDYSSFNRARHMKGNWAKVFLIFKQHSQNMTYHLAKNFHDGFVDKSDPEQAKAARKVLMTTLGLHGVFAGALGMPGMSFMLAAVGAAFGDEDDPKDYKVEFRNNLADVVGPQLAHALSKGLFDGYLNMGMHTRTRLNDLWFGDPGYDMSARQEAQYYMTHAMGGPFVAHLINSYVGITEMATGESMKGIQRIMPKFIRDGLRTIDYARNGIVDRSGKVIVDDVTVPEMAMQTFGITPARFGEAWDARGAISQYDTRLSKRRNDLLRQLDRAIRNDDQRLYDRTIANIERFNDSHKNREDTKGYIIPNRTIRRSLSSAQRRRDEAVHGVNLSSAKMGMVEHARGFQTQ